MNPFRKLIKDELKTIAADVVEIKANTRAWFEQSQILLEIRNTSNDTKLVVGRAAQSLVAQGQRLDGIVTGIATGLDAMKLLGKMIDDGKTAILGKLEDVAKKEDRIMATTDEILTDVQDEATVVGSVEQLLTNLSAQITAAGTDPVKLQAIKDGIDQNKARLTAAVVANTPAATPAP